MMGPMPHTNSQSVSYRTESSIFHRLFFISQKSPSHFIVRIVVDVLFSIGAALFQVLSFFEEKSNDRFHYYSHKCFAVMKMFFMYGGCCCCCSIIYKHKFVVAIGLIGGKRVPETNAVRVGKTDERPSPHNDPRCLTPPPNSVRAGQ